MSVGTMHVFGNAALHFASGGINWASDTIKCTLHSSTYTPDYTNHAHQSDLTGEVANGNGYTTGGVTLTSKASTLQASSAITAWASLTAYVVGQVRRPTVDNGHVYMCVVAGTSSGSAPTWPTTVGGTVVDGSVTWAEVGTHVVKLTGTVPAWTSSTFTARYAVIADTTPGSAATNPLICLIDFLSNQSPSNGSLTITIDTDGALVIPIRS